MKETIGEHTYVCDNGVCDVLDKTGNPYACPENLYKYYALTKYSVQAFCGRYLYASNPKDLNDIYDSTPLLVLADSESEAQCIINGKEDKESDIVSQWSRFYKWEDDFFSKWGIISLSTEYKNLLMWSHYAKNDGFCIRLRSNKLKFKHVGPAPIDYPQEAIEATKIINDNNEKWASLIALYQKSKEWSYEKEWRCCVPIESQACGYNNLSIDPRKCFYDKDAVTGVYFGYNFFDLRNSKYKEEYVYKRETDNWMILSRKAKILKYTMNNGYPAFINYKLRLDRFGYAECKIKEIDADGCRIIVQDWKKQ